MAKPIKVAIPDGFVEVDNSLAGFWKPTLPGQSIRGIVGHLIEAKSGRADGKMNRFYALRITDPKVSGPIVSGEGDKVIETEAGALVGVGGAIILSFLAEREGQEVYLVFKGMGRAKHGQNAPKLYATYARAIDPETGEVLA